MKPPTTTAPEHKIFEAFDQEPAARSQPRPADYVSLSDSFWRPLLRGCVFCGKHGGQPAMLKEARVYVHGLQAFPDGRTVYVCRVCAPKKKQTFLHDHDDDWTYQVCIVSHKVSRWLYDATGFRDHWGQIPEGGGPLVTWGELHFRHGGCNSLRTLRPARPPRPETENGVEVDDFVF